MPQLCGVTRAVDQTDIAAARQILPGLEPAFSTPAALPA
jgi:hypothetical protein